MRLREAQCGWLVGHSPPFILQKRSSDNIVQTTNTQNSVIGDLCVTMWRESHAELVR